MKWIIKCLMENLITWIQIEDESIFRDLYIEYYQKLESHLNKFNT